MITRDPVPAGQCRICRHCDMALWNTNPHREWRQQCKTVEDIEPEYAITEELAVRLETALIRLASHGDCPEFTSK